MYGLPADLDAIAAATEGRAHELGIPTPRIIVDAARACGAAAPGGPVGNGRQAWATVFSFHRKKHMTTLGEGGMVTTDDDQTAQHLRRLRSFGHGQQWGSSHRMTEHQAAVGLVQLNRLEEMLQPRIALARARTTALAGTPGLVLPPEPAGYRHVYYLYNLILDPGRHPAEARDQVRWALEADVGTVIANEPTYRANPYIADHTSDQLPLPTAEHTADRLVCLPLHPLMTLHDNELITQAVTTAMQRLSPHAPQAR